MESMNIKEIIKGLEKRHFVNTHEVEEMGKCNLDSKYYILIADGLVIYSNCPNWTECKVVRVWVIHHHHDDYSNQLPPFKFDELDDIINPSKK
jgi:hypothetical protein